VRYHRVTRGVSSVCTPYAPAASTPAPATACRRATLAPLRTLCAAVSRGGTLAQLCKPEQCVASAESKRMSETACTLTAGQPSLKSSFALDSVSVTEAAKHPLVSCCTVLEAADLAQRLWSIIALGLDTSAMTLSRTELGLPRRPLPGCTGRVGTQHVFECKLGRRCLGRTWVQRMGSGAAGGGGGTCGAGAGTGAW